LRFGELKKNMAMSILGWGIHSEKNHRKDHRAEAIRLPISTFVVCIQTILETVKNEVKPNRKKVCRELLSPTSHRAADRSIAPGEAPGSKEQMSASRPASVYNQRRGPRYVVSVSHILRAIPKYWNSI
jgi:hypothetical protein